MAIAKGNGHRAKKRLINLCGDEAAEQVNLPSEDPCESAQVADFETSAPVEFERAQGTLTSVEHAPNSEVLQMNQVLSSKDLIRVTGKTPLAEKTEGLITQIPMINKFRRMDNL